jgi:hypothetical protein
VRFYCGDAVVNMAAGECWIFDTWRLHRVLNDDEHSRVHLVIDTVGGERFWNHINGGQVPGQPKAGWRPQHIAPDATMRPELDFESTNVPTVMTPWEFREHFALLLNEMGRHPLAPAIQQALMSFTRRWHALWSCYGENREGWPRYRALLDQVRVDVLAAGAANIMLPNNLRISVLLDAIFAVALADNVGKPAEY